MQVLPMDSLRRPELRDCRAHVGRNTSIRSCYECSWLRIGHAGQLAGKRGHGWTGYRRIGISGEGGVGRQNRRGRCSHRRLERFGQRIEDLVGDARQLGRSGSPGPIPSLACNAVAQLAVSGIAVETGNCSLVLMVLTHIYVSSRAIASSVNMAAEQYSDTK